MVELKKLSERHPVLLMPEEWERLLWPEKCVESVGLPYWGDFGARNAESGLSDGDDESGAVCG
jgi:hypothetical protein